MYLFTYSPGYLSYLNCLRLMLNCCILRRNLLGNLHIKEFIVLANSKFTFIMIFMLATPGVTAILTTLVM